MKKDNVVSLEKRYPVLLAAIALAALLIRYSLIYKKVFFIDEAFSYMLASFKPSDIIRGSISESNPPLPMLLFHIWQLMGSAESYLRMLPVILNLLTIPVVFALGRHINGTAAGLGAAGLFALTADMIDVSLIYRYPSLLTFVGALFALLYFKSSDSLPAFPIRTLFLITIVEIAGLYTHYFFIFIVIGFNVIAIWDVAVARRIQLARYAAWLVSQAFAAVAFAPWTFAFRHQATKELAVVPYKQLAAHLTQLPFGAIPRVLISYVLGPATSVGPVALTAATGVIIAAAFAFYFIDKKNRVRRFRLVAAFLTALTVPYLMMLLLGLRLDTIYFCGSAPMFFAIVAAAVFPKDKKRVFHSIGAVLLVAAAVTGLIIYQKHVAPSGPDNRAAISIIGKEYMAGDIVVVNPTYQSSLFEYYAPNQFNLFGIPTDFDILKYNFNDTTQVTEARLNELSRLVGVNGHIWAFMGFGTRTKPDQTGLTIRYLTDHFKLVRDTKFVPTSFSSPVGRLFLFENKPVTKN